MSKAKVIRREVLSMFLHEQGGRIFAVEFIKKDGTNRLMVCKIKRVMDSERSSRPWNRNWGTNTCITVYDVQKRAYRHVNLSTVTKVKASRVEYAVI